MIPVGTAEAADAVAALAEGLDGDRVVDELAAMTRAVGDEALLR